MILIARLSETNYIHKNNSNKYLNHKILRFYSINSHKTSRLINFFENISSRTNESVTYHSRGQKFFGSTKPLDKDANFVLFNKHRLQMSNNTFTVNNKRSINKNKLSTLWTKLVQFDPSFIVFRKYSKITKVKFNYLSSLTLNSDRIRFVDYYLHPILLSEYSSAILSFQDNINQGMVKSNSSKYLNIPVFCKSNNFENSIRLPWFTRLPFSSILLVVIPESLTFYFVSTKNLLNFIKFNFIKFNNLNWTFDNERLLNNIKTSKNNKNYFINLELGFKRTHLINPLYKSVDINVFTDVLFKNSIPFLNNSKLLNTKTNLLSDLKFVNDLIHLQVKKQPIKESFLISYMRKKFTLSLIALNLLKFLYLSKYKICSKFNNIFFNIIKMGWNLLFKTLRLKIIKPLSNLKYFTYRATKTFSKFWLSLNTANNTNLKTLSFFSTKFTDLNKRSFNLLTIYKSKFKIYKFFKKLIRKGFDTFEWKFFDRKWYFKYSRWKYSVLFKIMIKEAWNNYRKINKNFLFVKFFKVHVFNILGLKDWDLWYLWKQVRFGNNINYNSSAMQRFNQFLQLKLDSLVLLLNIMPNRPLAQEFVKFGSLRVSGSVETNFNKSLLLNDILQIELNSAVKIKKLYSKVGRFYKDQTKLYDIQEVTRSLPFLQILNSFMLIMLVRYPTKYEMVSESILSDRWIRFYVRYFPVRMAKYSKPKVKWFKY